MTVYGLTRASTRKQQASPEVQREMIRKHCAAVQLPEPVMLDEPLGTSGRSVDFRHRTEGRWLLLHAQAGDVLVVTKLDRLGRTAKDILDTLERLATLLTDLAGWDRVRLLQKSTGLTGGLLIVARR
jgi:DNA invertase Pin-like site-specific DNA recombinase